MEKQKISNEEMLIKLRLDRPEQVIHEVLSFEKNEYGYFDVKVDMEIQFFETKVRHAHMTLPYPYQDYCKNPNFGF